MDLQLNLVKRDLMGKKAKQLIEEGAVLGNVFGSDIESQAVKGDYNEVNKVISTAGFNMPVELKIKDGKDSLALVHEVERDMVTQRLHHVSFQVVKRGQKVRTEVPIKLISDAPAERTGKIVITIADHVEVEATPSKLPEHLEVSIESLEEEHDAVKVSDIIPIEGVEIITDPEFLVAKVDIPRAEVEEEPEEEIDPADIPSEHGADEGGADTEGDDDSGKEEKATEN